MRDVKDLLAVAVGPAEPKNMDVDGVLRRAAAHRRRERLLAGALALALSAGLTAGLVLALHHGGPAVPLDQGIVGPTRIVYIPSTSMEPTLRPGDQVLVDEGAYGGGLPQHGDIVAFAGDDPALSPPGFVWVKRVIGLPGDTVEERNGAMYVNGREMALPSEGIEPDHHTLGPWVVPPEHFFVVGDDLANSNDSRFGLGYVPVDGLIGRVVEILGPESRVGGLTPPEAPVAEAPNPSTS